MTQFTMNAVIYGIATVAIVLVAMRWQRRKRREAAALEHTIASRASGRQPASEAAAPVTAVEPAPQPATPLAPSAGVPDGVQRPAAAFSVHGQSQFDRTASDYVPRRGEASSAGMAQTPSIFKTLGRKSASINDPLPVIEVDDTPLADTSHLVFGPLTPTLASLLPDSEERRTQVKQELKNAGFYQPGALLNLSAIRYVCIMAPLLLLGCLLLIAPPAAEKYIVGGIVLLPICGWAMPRLFVKSRAADRTSQIERALPDMLDMLNMCVSQGMTVPAALKRVSQDLPAVHPALHKELQIVTEQAKIGTMQHALENFNKRIDVPEVHSFTSLLIQTEQMGTSVSTALADYSDNMREGLKQRADEKGNQAAFKLLFPTVLCLMPAVYLFLLGPSIIELSNFFRRDTLNLQQANDIIQRTGRTGNRGR